MTEKGELERKPEVIDLVSGGNKAAVSVKGATVESWSVGGRPVLFTKQDVYDRNGQLVDKPRGGMEICGPNFGPPGERGSKLGLERHGFMRNEMWHPVAKSGRAVNLELTRFQGLAPTVPYRDLDAYANYLLEGNSIDVRLAIHHHKKSDDTELPVSPGFHPYFMAGKSTEFTIDGVRYDLDETIARAGDPLILKNLKQLKVNGSIIDFQTNSLDTFVVWSDGSTDGDGNRYICVEPTHAGAAFADGSYGILPRGDSADYRCRMTCRTEPQAENLAAAALNGVI
jgi:D-hexose-6-phosphate mutarotase